MLLARITEKSGSHLQLSTVRDHSCSGLAVGRMLSSAMGVRGILQMILYRSHTKIDSLDPGLGVKLPVGFFDHSESVGEEDERIRSLSSRHYSLFFFLKRGENNEMRSYIRT
jgi:hypothetical protein